MDVAVSKVERGAQGSVDWHIENWTADFDLLKDFAACTLMITNDTGELGSPKPVKIRFLFDEHQVKDSSHRVTSSHLSLCGELVSGGHAPMVISVDLETSTKNPGYFVDKQCTMEKHGKIFTVQEKFIIKEGTYNQQGQYVSEYPKHNELRFKITATILNINKNEFSADSEECTVGAGQETSLIKDVKMMYSCEDNYSDLKIEAKDNLSLSAHRFILAARSPAFRKLIDEQLKKEDFMGIIKISTVNAEALKVILHWMYTGELHANIGTVMEEVIQACVHFEIPALLKILDKKLITICTTENMFQLFRAVQKHGLPTAKETISEFIKENIGSV